MTIQNKWEQTKQTQRQVASADYLSRPHTHFHKHWKNLENKTRKEWKTQGSWNETIAITKKKFTKVFYFMCYNHKPMSNNK